jgi:2'-5' RNA ligase
MSLGTYPHLTLARARALRDEYLSLLANGIDPQVHNNDKANALKMLLNTHSKLWQANG